MMTVKDGNKEYTFESFDAYLRWDAERCRKIKEEKEKKEKAEREASLARLTEEDKKQIAKLKERIDEMNLASDVFSFEEREVINELNRQIREIRGF